MKKGKEFSCLFGHNIISNGLYQAIKNNIVAKKTTELVLLFHTKTTKLVFLLPNMGQKSIKVLNLVIVSDLVIDLDLVKILSLVRGIRSCDGI